MLSYYNEWDANAAQWLENLVAAGRLPRGFVDRTDIKDIHPVDLRDYQQCHFFAGIGGWPLALQMAGWPDDIPVWTGSCPCQPFSTAGQQKGTEDERHLWPTFRNLIEKHRPPVVFGEQVASKLGRSWLSGVQADLEALGYAVGAADLCAAGVGAPHIRQRLFWGAQRLADANLPRPETERVSGRVEEKHDSTRNSEPVGGLADAVRIGQQGQGKMGRSSYSAPGEDREISRVEYDGGRGRLDGSQRSGTHKVNWRDADWLFCRDGKWRPVEPSTLPLAHGYPARMGRLRAYGNAIVPEVAATFIKSFMEAM